MHQLEQFINLLKFSQYVPVFYLVLLILYKKNVIILGTIAIMFVSGNAIHCHNAIQASDEGMSIKSSARSKFSFHVPSLINWSKVLNSLQSADNPHTLKK